MLKGHHEFGVQHTAIARVLRELGRREEAFEHLETASTILSKALPPGHFETLSNEEVVVAVLCDQGRPDLAAARLEQVQLLNVNTEQEDHFCRIVGMQNTIAVGYTEQGEASTALEWVNIQMGYVD